MAGTLLHETWRAERTFENLALSTVFAGFENGGTVLSPTDDTTSLPVCVICPFNGTIVGCVALLFPSSGGSISVEVRKCTYEEWDGGAAHPSAADKISGTSPIVISSATKSLMTDLSAWSTTTINAGDILEFRLNSVTSAIWLHVGLLITKA